MDMKMEIQEWKKRRNAVILAHNYQLDEVQELADFVGDSFQLSRLAAESTADVIVFCGVRFMAETAKILAPTKLVLLPESEAGCPLADMIDVEGLRELKAAHPGVPVVCYINSSAAVKAESDICCTSANAVEVVRALAADSYIFAPDAHLGHFVAQQVPDKKAILWDGFCVTHAKVRAADVRQARKMHPGAEILVHPECHPTVVELADFAGSTSAILARAAVSSAEVVIIGTEMGVLERLRRQCPDKRFYLLHPGLVCPNMKKTTPASVLQALQELQESILVEDSLAKPARRMLDRMLEIR